MQQKLGLSEYVKNTEECMLKVGDWETLQVEETNNKQTKAWRIARMEYFRAWGGGAYIMQNEMKEKEKHECMKRIKLVTKPVWRQFD